MALPYGFGALLPSTIAQYGRDADGLRKVRAKRAELYKETPAEKMQTTPLVRMLLSQVGDMIPSSKYEWGMKPIITGNFDATQVYSENTLTSGIGSTAKTAAGTTVYIKTTEDQVIQTQPLEIIELRYMPATGARPSIMLDVIECVRADDSSYIKARTLYKDEGNVLGKTADLLGTVVTFAAPEGAKLPGGLYQEEHMTFNYAQIFMAAYSATGSEMADRTHFSDSGIGEDLWDQTYDAFNLKLERAFKQGVRERSTATISGDGGTQTVYRYQMGGLEYFHRTHEKGNFLRMGAVDELFGEDFSGKTWEAAGYHFLKHLLLNLSKKGRKEKVMLASDVVVQDICNMLEGFTNVTVGPLELDKKWGFIVNQISGLNCDLKLVQDADLSLNPAWSRKVYIAEPASLKVYPRLGRDVTLIRSSADLEKAKSLENGFDWRDGIKEGIVADLTLAIDNLEGQAVIEDWGSDFAAA